MLNALRLTDGVPATLFAERTGYPLADRRARARRGRRDAACSMPTRSGCARPQLGRRFLNDLQALFLPLARAAPIDAARAIARHERRAAPRARDARRSPRRVRRSRAGRSSRARARRRSARAHRGDRTARSHAWAHLDACARAAQRARPPTRAHRAGTVARHRHRREGHHRHRRPADRDRLAASTPAAGPPRDAACVARLHAAGAYVFGKTVTTAFAFMRRRRRRAIRGTRAHTPGGSSSGSAAAVAAGQVLRGDRHADQRLGHPAGRVLRRRRLQADRTAARFHRGVHRVQRHVRHGRHVHAHGARRGAARQRARAAPVASRRASLPRASAARSRSSRRFPWSDARSRTPPMRSTAAAVRLRDAGATVSRSAFPDAWRDAHRVHRTIMLYEGARALGGAAGRASRAAVAADQRRARRRPRHRRRPTIAPRSSAREQAIAYFTEWLGAVRRGARAAATGAAPRGLASTGDPALLHAVVAARVSRAIALPTGLDATACRSACSSRHRAAATMRLLRVAAWCEARLACGARIAPCAPSAPMKRAKLHPPPKPRNPVARSPLLGKGGAHEKSTRARRGATRRSSVQKLARERDGRRDR